MSEALLWDVFRVKTKIEISLTTAKSTFISSFRLGGYASFLPAPCGNPLASGVTGKPVRFNIGFYAVVPFLALFLRDDMLLSGGLIGLILGLRTFSQQGMFILGGTLADRYGAKAIILAGCVVRVAGFLLLACGASLWPIILGACLTGVGGALFSPSIEALLARAGTLSRGKRSRAEWFALFAVCGELGAVIGPVAGGVLSGSAFGISPRRRGNISSGAGGALSVCPPTGTRQQRADESHGGRLCASRALSRLFSPTAHGC